MAFKFAEGVTAEEQQAVVDAFMALKRQIPSIVSLDAGLNNSPEGANQGYTDVFVVTFRTNEERTDYVFKNPAHQRFKALVGPLLDPDHGALVLDFDVTRAYE